MKRIYISAWAIFIGLAAFAQSKTTKGFEKLDLQPTIDDGATIKPSKTPINKAPGDTIWYEDFTNGLPADWYVQDNTGNNYDWVINNADIQNTTATPPGYTNASAIASTSGGNHMLLFSDEYNRTNLTGIYDDMDSYFQTRGIQVNNFAGVAVNFQQTHRRCCGINPVAVLSVSTDSTFATNFQEYDIIQGMPNSVASPDPMNMSINISAIAANYTGKIWLRFHIKSGISHYYWMIDDIAVAELNTNDMITEAPYYGFTSVGTYGFQYTRIPVSHIQSADFTMIVNNIGTADQTGTNLTVDISDGTSSVFNQSTADITLPSLTTDTLKMFGAWTPPATVGVPYAVTLAIFSDSTDVTPSNNSYTFPPFQVSDYTIALDNYEPYDRLAVASPTQLEHEIGNYFRAAVADTVSGIEFLAGVSTTIGISIDAVLYRGSYQNGLVEIARSANYILAASDTVIPKTLLLKNSMGASPVLEKDSVYFMGIHTDDEYFHIETSGGNPAPGSNAAQHSHVFFPTASNAVNAYSPIRTPVVRLNLNPALRTGIHETRNAVQFNVFPNPSNGVFNINITAEEENTVTVTVKNIVGQTLITENVAVAGNTKHTVSLENYSKGIYFLTVGNKTEKLIVK